MAEYESILNEAKVQVDNGEEVINFLGHFV
jgi:hypothetical protein